MLEKLSKKGGVICGNGHLLNNINHSYLHIDDETSAHGGITSSPLSKQCPSVRPADLYTLDHTGITAARKKRVKVLGMKNNKEGLLKTKQFQMLMPDKPMNTEEMLYASKEQRDAKLRRSKLLSAEYTLQAVH